MIQIQSMLTLKLIFRTMRRDFLSEFLFTALIAFDNKLTLDSSTSSVVEYGRFLTKSVLERWTRGSLRSAMTPDNTYYHTYRPRLFGNRPGCLVNV